ncbi:MAG: hypothetical protein JXR94_24025 [Candidatus Hydrogenedentes bacterium]|nr:hypothetical protein [Candidatus Hydrogenedentota bacterium]
MSSAKTLIIGAILAVFLVSAAGAVEPAYKGKLGNPEEPATRVYKAFWRGCKAMKYQTVKAAKEGNEKVPGWGYVQALRGVRRGTVELASSTYFGMAGRRPDDVEAISKANEYIDKEEHKRLRTVADGLPVSAFLGMVGAPYWAAALAAVPFSVGQVMVDEEGARREELLRAPAPEATARAVKSVPQTIRCAADAARKARRGEDRPAKLARSEKSGPQDRQDR